MFHPFLTTGLIIDVVGLVACLLAAVCAAKTLIGRAGQPGEASRQCQERPDRRAPIAYRIAAVSFLLGSLVWVVAIAAVLPGEIKNTMCGSGVLRAMQGLGAQSLILRGIGFLLLYSWFLLNTLHRIIPHERMVPAIARAWLLLVPVFFLAVSASLRAVIRLDPNIPVDCCSKVLEQTAGVDGRSLFGGVTGWIWPSGWGALGVLVGLYWLRGFSRQSRISVRMAGLFGLVVWLWVWVSVMGLVYVLGPYCYGDPNHHCAWCLLSPGYGMLGFALYGSLGLALAETVGILLCARVSAFSPGYADLGRMKIKRSIVKILVSMLFFLLLAGVTALVFGLPSAQ